MVCSAVYPNYSYHGHQTIRIDGEPVGDPLSKDEMHSALDPTHLGTYTQWGPLQSVNC